LIYILFSARFGAPPRFRAPLAPDLIFGLMAAPITEHLALLAPAASPKG